MLAGFEPTITGSQEENTALTRVILIDMIKNILKRREDSDAYLTHVCKYRDLSAPAMSTDMSQVGVALFPSF
jgi:hypothetical protein